MTPLIFLGLLSVLVLVHELGHFAAARVLGIKVEEFALGLPFTPPIFSFKYKGTTYAVYPVLFGGFVKLFGEETAVKKERQRSFWSRGRKQRMLVVGAGVVANVVLAMVAFVILYTAVGVPSSKKPQVTILRVEEGSPADLAGVKPEDWITTVENKKIESSDEFSRLMRSWAGLEVNLTVRRGGMKLLEGIAELGVEEKVMRIKPRENPPTGQGPVGVAIAEFPYLVMSQCSMSTSSRFASNAQCSVAAVGAGVNTTLDWGKRVLTGLRDMGKSIVRGKAPEGLAGPVGIYQITGIVAKGGGWPVLELLGVLSINLAVFNILPIPALDGGRMFFIWLEWARRKRISVELEQKINAWGMAVLIGLLVLISLQDVVRLVIR